VRRPPRAIGYRRLSKLEPASVGLAQQAHAIAAAAARLGLPLDATYTDADLSGGLPLEERPGLVDAIGALGPGDVLVVAKRDRLGRDTFNVALIQRLVERQGARIVSAAGEGTDSDDPASRLLRQMVDSFAEYERALIRQRTKAALATKRARGERVGNIRFGFRLSGDGRTLEPHPSEQRAIRVMRDLRAAGCSCQAIADELTAQGFCTRTGRPWIRTRVHAVLHTAAA